MPRKPKQKEEDIEETNVEDTEEVESEAESKTTKTKKKEARKTEKTEEKIEQTKLAQETEETNAQETEENKTEHHEQKHTAEETEQTSAVYVWIIAIVTILLVFNQIQLAQINGLFAPVQTTNTATTSATHQSAANTQISLDGNYEILAPALLAHGETPVLANHGTKIKKFPTISAQAKKDPTGDATQDAINTLIPTGMPFYGQEAGVSFDDPIAAQKTWAKYERTTQLDEAQQQRWLKIVNAFTCDYCCGSPARPTIITRCGCSHAAAWRGMSKWFINKFGDKYDDLQITGELSKWKALWYPGPTIQRVLAEQQATNGNVGTTAGSLDNLPGMVGGC